MKNVILFDDDIRDRLLPLTYTRPMGEFRVGILTIREKWERWLNAKVSYITQNYLSEKYPIQIEQDNFVISGSALPSAMLCQLIEQLEPNEALLQDGNLIATRLDETQFQHLIKEEEIDELQGFEMKQTPFIRIQSLTDIFTHNDQAIREDFDLITKDRKSQPIPEGTMAVEQGSIFIEEGAKVNFAQLNASTGPIYIGKDAEIMEGSVVRGPLAMCANSKLKLGSKVYGATTLGPHCKVGGEVSNSVLFGYSSKAHEGYLGNSVLGEWCNIGAGTSCSNLKNNYSEIRLWSYPDARFAPTGLQFCGLFMGDHSKCGINSMFNTGTVVGVSANIFGPGFPRNFIPSFAWGGSSGFSTYKTEKAFEVAEKVFLRRNKEFDQQERNILLEVFKLSQAHRRWEKTMLQ